MKAARIIAILVCGLLAFSMLQGISWPLRPEPGWQPAWWQSRNWAGFGFLLSFPALLPMILLQMLEIKIVALQAVLGCLALVVGFGGEFVFTYALAYYSARFIFRLLTNTHKDETVA